MAEYKESPFYIYVKHVGVPSRPVSFTQVSSEQLHSAFTYVGIFSSRNVADTWWRRVSTCKDESIRDSITRIRPQFYTQKNVGDVLATIKDKGCFAGISQQT